MAITCLPMMALSADVDGTGGIKPLFEQYEKEEQQHHEHEELDWAERLPAAEKLAKQILASPQTKDQAIAFLLEKKDTRHVTSLAMLTLVSIDAQTRELRATPMLLGRWPCAILPMMFLPAELRTRAFNQLLREVGKPPKDIECLIYLIEFARFLGDDETAKQLTTLSEDAELLESIPGVVAARDDLIALLRRPVAEREHYIAQELAYRRQEIDSPSYMTMVKNYQVMAARLKRIGATFDESFLQSKIEQKEELAAYIVAEYKFANLAPVLGRKLKQAGRDDGNVAESYSVALGHLGAPGLRVLEPLMRPGYKWNQEILQQLTYYGEKETLAALQKLASDEHFSNSDQKELVRAVKKLQDRLDHPEEYGR